MHELYTLKVHGTKGGRDYLRMVREVIPKDINVHEILDFKRYYSMRKWSKVRHLIEIVKHIPYKHSQAFFLWDDLSLITFSREMLEKTIFIIHHYDPITFDSSFIESWMWEKLFKALQHCYAVVCVSQFWANFLKERGIQPHRIHIIYNSFDMDIINEVNKSHKDQLKESFNLPMDKINVYLGKAERFKGVEAIYKLLREHTDLNLVTSGNNELNLPVSNYDYLDYFDYLKLIRSCDIGIFNSEVKEGWTRCAAEAILLQLPCLLKPIAGLENLADFAFQSKLVEHDMPELHNVVVSRLKETTEEEIIKAYRSLSQFDKKYFRREWSSLIYSLLNN
jgi:glycosyltransferase involved in cell wall biosynthesis